MDSSFPELCVSNDLFEFDEFSSFLDYIEYYKCCVDDSELSDKKIQANYVSIKNHKMHPLESFKNTSICSLEETDDPTSVDSSLIKIIDKNQKISSNYDRSKPNSVISTNTIVDELNRLSISSDGSICTNNTMSEIKSNGNNDKKINVDVSNDEFDVKALITNHVRCLRKLKGSSCQPNHFTKTEEKKLEKKKISSKTNIIYNDIEPWWTDSDDTDGEN